MQKNQFLYLLLGASYASFRFAKTYLENNLISEFRYDVKLNASSDNPDLKQFDIYPEDNEKTYFDLEEKEVLDLLFRKNKVPVWIDISVSKSNKKYTTLSLTCAGRYSSDIKEFYYVSNGSGPFGIKSPNLPPNYKEGKKFKLK